MNDKPILICPVAPEFKTSAKQKLMSKEAAHRTKFGSPKLRDLLREKCRIRVKEARNDSFENTRTTFISKIIREELANFENDIKLQEEIYNELAIDLNEYLVAELETEENYLIESGEIDVLFCPLCQKSDLNVDADIFKCVECDFCLTYKKSKADFRSEIETTVKKHGDNCESALVFFIEPETKANIKYLNTFCEKCDFYYNFV